jgi:hypothetical protein
MTTSGTYNFAPGAGDLVLAAFARTGKRRSQVLAEHLADAYNEANLMLSDWSTRPGPNWWATDTTTTPLIQGTATYTLAASTIQLVQVYITTSTGGSSFDRPLGPLSTVNYTSLSNKAQQGNPTSFWFDRQITPQISLWPVPDRTGIYTMNIRRWRQPQDSVLAGGIQPEVPWRFIDAFVWGIAARMAWIYAPERAQVIEARAEKAFAQAATNDEENVAIHLTPGLGSYFE